ncbi:ABC transporter permease [Thermochromatium tepidum]|uniref:FtsX-like permease family protein n=1 Tax=Thermochromatium tepidum ATCC 43061 TaxID=316276 RepID=A0A6I6E1V4_THETI|nr:FtsX-like permease family protein [Thermochromatium tepidum]QGU33874.1 FtsX-like permease family protein [Thermochromatium tepidum ATCC 43061]
MNAWRLTWRLLRRDWRSGELYLLSAALVVTVAATTAVGFFTDRIEATLKRQGNELLAADLALESSRPLDIQFATEAQARGLETATTLEFRSVVMGERPQLVSMKAVDPGYPLRGHLRIAATRAGPDRPVASGPLPGEVWVESRLLRLLGLELGATLEVGAAHLRLGAILTDEPDQGRAVFSLAPRVLMNRADLDATGLIGPASRATHRLLIAGQARAIADYRDWARTRLAANVKLTDALEARPEFGAAVERASGFLHLATLVTLLVSGAAIVLAGQRLVERQTDTLAVMRCLGAPRRLAMQVLVGRLLLLGVIASLVGCLTGWLGQLGLVAALGDWLGDDLPPASPAPVLTGLATGLLTLLSFAWLPLIQLARVPPLRALRRELGTPRPPALLALGMAGLTLTSLILWQAKDLELGLMILGGVLATLFILAANVYLLLQLAGRLVGCVRGVWRLGLAALTRRPGTAALQILGFGIGSLALLLLTLVRVDLLESWRKTLPEGAPNYFLINIQPHEVEPLQSFLSDSGIRTVKLHPMVSGRLIRIGERRVEPSDYDDPRAVQLASREFNLSYDSKPQSDNRIVAGQWWTEAAEVAPQFSVERGLAETLGIRLGDTLTFWVSGHEVSAPVTSLRAVRWDSFNVNFFVVATPKLLQGEPATFITSFHLPRERESLIAELARRFPSVSVLDVETILGQVRQVIDRGALAIESVFLFTLAAGFLVMYAGIQASLEQRRTEHAILRTLGARRRRLLMSLALEFTLAGLLAGLLAAVCAEMTAWWLAERIFELEFRLDLRLWVIGVLGSGLAIGLAGTLATYPLLIHPPLRALRAGNG